MAIRRILRGQIAWDRLEKVMLEVTERYDERPAHVSFLDADNWLSTPCVLNEQFFVKVISRQHSLLHALLTTGRNLGAVSSGTEGFFEHFGTPLQMAAHELEATERMREIGLNVPEPQEAFEVDGLGVVVLEYLPEFETLEELDEGEIQAFAPSLFEQLARMHESNLAHGDLRGENVLVTGGELYFIDATKVSDEGVEDARSYDVACALAALAPLIGAREAVASASYVYSTQQLLAAREFLDFVNMRPDHDFDSAAVKGEIEKRAT